ncbi:MAG TPA: O-antigen polymerase, partial [Longimicrobium sp.]|nr:O-antigen polymerase [Longimicrobium sp.]
MRSAWYVVPLTALMAGLLAVPLLTASVDELVPWILLLVLTGLMVATLAAERGREGFFDVFAPFSVAVWGVVMVLWLPAVLRLVLPPGSVRAHGIPYVSSALFSEALMLAILGFVGMYAGYSVRLGSQVAVALPVPPATWHAGRAWLVAGAYTAIALAAYYSLIRSFGGMAGFMGVVGRSAYVKEENLILFAGAVILRVGVLIALTAWIFRRERRWPSLALLAYLVFALGVTLLLRGRGRALSILVIGLLMYHYGRRKLRFRQFFILVLCGALSLVMLDGVFSVMQGMHFFSSMERMDLVSYLGRAKKLDKLGTFFLVLQGIPSQLEYQWGRTILAVPFDFLPKNLVAEPPEGASRVFTRTFFPSAYAAGVGVPPSLFTELYMNFGAMGIAVGSFVLGLWVDALRYLGGVVRSHPGLLLVHATMVYYTFSLVTSVLETSVPHMLMDVGPAVLAVLFVTRFRL